MIAVTTTMMILPLAAEPPGGRHGIWHQAHGRAVGRVGSSAFLHRFGRRFPQLPDHSDVAFQGYHRFHRRATGLFQRNSGPRPQALSARRRPSVASGQAAGPTWPRHARISAADEAGRADQSADAGLWIFDLVHGAFGRAPGQGHGPAIQRGPVAATASSRGIFRSTAQAHAQRQTQRGGLRKGPGGTDALKKTR